jgi:phage I-like protein
MPKQFPHPHSAAIAVAACSVELPSLPADGPIRLQLMPAGEFRPQDAGRTDLPVTGAWRIDAAAAAQVITRCKARATQPVIDFDHQTLYVRENGKPAPAAAWITDLEWVEGAGLFGLATLTQRGREAIESGEYRYLSPVFAFDKQTGTVLDFKLAAFTNLPAIDGMEPLTAAASQTFAADLAALSQQLSTISKEEHMDELLEQLRWLLNLPVGATPEDVTAQLQKLIDQLKAGAPEATAAASFELAAFLGNQGEQIAALSQQAATAGKPDPALFVPMAMFADVQQKLAALSQQSGASELDRLIEKGVADGKLTPAMTQWARDLGAANLAALSQFLDTSPAIAVLTQAQTRSTPPVVQKKDAVTDDAVVQAVCSQLNLTPEQFAKGRI